MKRPYTLALKPCVCGSVMPPEVKQRGRHSLKRLECTLCGFHGAGCRHAPTLYANWNRAVDHATRKEEDRHESR